MSHNHLSQISQHKTTQKVESDSSDEDRPQKNKSLEDEEKTPWSNKNSDLKRVKETAGKGTSH